MEQGEHQLSLERPGCREVKGRGVRKGRSQTRGPASDQEGGRARRVAVTCNTANVHRFAPASKITGKITKREGQISP